MARTFTAQVSDWTRKCERRMRAVAQESAQRLMEEVQTPRAQGGKMPVDTNFLRASFRVSLDGLPFGQAKNPGKVNVTWNDGEATLVIAQAQIGDTIWGGWTAEYAPFMELRYGFLRSGAQNWQQIVDGVVAEAQRRFP